jgi:hypothetical protein
LIYKDFYAATEASKRTGIESPIPYGVDRFIRTFGRFSESTKMHLAN